MGLKQIILADLKTAMLGGDKFATETLRGLNAAILSEEVAQGKREEGLGDETIQNIVAKEIKKRLESATLYEQNGRVDSANDEKKEAEIMAKYLPAQLSEDELQIKITQAIQQVGATSPADMGKVIGAVKQQVGNSADGATIARLVKAALLR